MEKVEETREAKGLLDVCCLSFDTQETQVLQKSVLLPLEDSHPGGIFIKKIAPGAMPAKACALGLRFRMRTAAKAG